MRIPHPSVYTSPATNSRKPATQKEEGTTPRPRLLSTQNSLATHVSTMCQNPIANVSTLAKDWLGTGVFCQAQRGGRNRKGEGGHTAEQQEAVLGPPYTRNNKK
ncbi:hypothetical protein E2C01_063587 [Portunus trituberculatus]|uniref:Uncharacterized protein n=1 Tax=Portunus trituberculatus TaxID=210409 RepID=A0A5B7HIJ8_PORTR|nr:hypothetical protein [Portunus trituberculatus]